MKKYKLLPRDKSVKNKNVENIAYDEIITNVIQGKHFETKEQKEKRLRLNDIFQNVRVETPNHIKSNEEKEKDLNDKKCEKNIISTGYIKQITLSPNDNRLNTKSNKSDLTKKFIKLEKENLELKCKLEQSSLVILSKQKKEMVKDKSPISKLENFVKLEQKKIISKGSSSPNTILKSRDNNLRLIKESKISPYLTSNKRLIITKNIDNPLENIDNKNITKLKQAFSPKHREVIHESGNKMPQSQHSNKLFDKKSYKYLESKKSEQSINLERKPSLNVLRKNLVASNINENISPYFTNNLTTIKNPSKFLTPSLSIKTDNFIDSKDENFLKSELSEKLEKNSSCKNLSSNGNYRIINLKDKVVMKTFSPKPIQRSPAIGITESFNVEIKERVFNNKPSENNFSLKKLNSFLNKPKTSSSSKLNIFLVGSDSDKSLQILNPKKTCENKNKCDDSINSGPKNTSKTSTSNKNKSLISQKGIPTVSTTLCDTRINQQLITNENGTLSSSVSFTNSEGSCKGVRSLSEARKSKQMEKAAFGNFNSITKNYQDCINNALNSITKELRRMDTIKSSVSASVGV